MVLVLSTHHTVFYKTNILFGSLFALLRIYPFLDQLALLPHPFNRYSRNRACRAIEFTGSAANAFFCIDRWQFVLLVSHQGNGCGWTGALAHGAGYLVCCNNATLIRNRCPANLQNGFFSLGDGGNCCCWADSAAQNARWVTKTMFKSKTWLEKAFAFVLAAQNMPRALSHTELAARTVRGEMALVHSTGRKNGYCLGSAFFIRSVEEFRFTLGRCCLHSLGKSQEGHSAPDFFQSLASIACVCLRLVEGQGIGLTDILAVEAGNASGGIDDSLFGIDTVGLAVVFTLATMGTQISLDSGSKKGVFGQKTQKGSERADESTPQAPIAKAEEKQKQKADKGGYERSHAMHKEGLGSNERAVDLLGCPVSGIVHQHRDRLSNLACDAPEDTVGFKKGKKIRQPRKKAKGKDDEKKKAKPRYCLKKAVSVFFAKTQQKILQETERAESGAVDTAIDQGQGKNGDEHPCASGQKGGDKLYLGEPSPFLCPHASFTVITKHKHKADQAKKRQNTTNCFPHCPYTLRKSRTYLLSLAISWGISINCGHCATHCPQPVQWLAERSSGISLARVVRYC